MVKYKVTLSQEEREELGRIISKGKHSSQVYRNAYMLLNCDEGKYGQKITGKEICRVLKVSMRMIDRVKKRFADESPKQLIRETRVPIKAGRGREARYDYEYERCGVCNVFMVNEPLIGKRYVKVTDRKTKQDWAELIREIADERYPKDRLKNNRQSLSRLLPERYLKIRITDIKSSIFQSRRRRNTFIIDSSINPAFKILLFDLRRQNEHFVIVQ